MYLFIDSWIYLFSSFLIIFTKSRVSIFFENLFSQFIWIMFSFWKAIIGFGYIFWEHFVIRQSFFGCLSWSGLLNLFKLGSSHQLKFLKILPTCSLCRPRSIPSNKCLIFSQIPNSVISSFIEESIPNSNFLHFH